MAGKIYFTPGRNKFFFWSGFYTSKPGFKKQIKDSSSLLTSVYKLYARKFIDQTTTNEQIKEMQGASWKLLD